MPAGNVVEPTDAETKKGGVGSNYGGDPKRFNRPVDLRLES
jgi:hypothetical protein